MARRPLPTPDVAIAEQGQPPEISRLMTQDWYDFFRELARPALTSLTFPTSTGGTIATDARAGDSFLIVATSPTPFVFTIGAPSNPVAGQVVTYTIRNTSGGALGAITWNAVFKMPAFVSPATGFSRSVTFHYNGTNWIQRYQSAADVPN